MIQNQLTLSMNSPKHPHLSRISHFFRQKASQTPHPSYSSFSSQLRSTTQFNDLKNIRTSPPPLNKQAVHSTTTSVFNHNQLSRQPRFVGLKDFLSVGQRRSFHYQRSDRQETRKQNQTQPTASSSEQYSALSMPGAVGATAALSMFGLSDNGDRTRGKMKDRLREHGFEEKRIQGDGNCQFRAIADQVYGDEAHHARVRKDIIEWLSSSANYTVDKDGTKLSDFLETDTYPSWSSYCSRMARDGYWGDHMTLIAASELYKANIFIISSVDAPDGTTPTVEITPRSAKPENQINLSLHHEKHYNSMYRINRVEASA